MTSTSNPPASGLLARLASTLVAPRRAMHEAIHAGPGAIAATWSVVLGACLVAAAWLPSESGRQALVDERVRGVEAFGGVVDDARYRAWQADPPWGTYLVSGGRPLLLPVTTLGVAAALFLWVRRHGPGVRYRAVLSIAVHASVVLAVQQLLAAPLHVARESLTSPFNLAALVPLFDEGSAPARVLGAIEVFGLWWVLLLAIGAAAATGRSLWAYAVPALGAYLAVAVLAGAAVALTGGA